MDLKTSNRTALKSHFVRNAVPTQGDFADLIDGMINQREDGIAKPPGEPLGIQADTGNSSQTVINFYKNFADPKPAWTLSLNPRGDPGKPETAKAGWSIGDADGRSSLFIDEKTGNLGVGTVDPGVYKLNVVGPVLVNGGVVVTNTAYFQGKVGIGTGNPGASLEVKAASTTAAGWLEAIRFSRPEHSAITHPGGGLLFGMHGDRKFYFTDIEGGTFRKNLMTISAIDGASFNGKVGIGTDAPQASLEVKAASSTAGGWLEAIRFSRPEHSAITHPGGGLLFGMHGDRNFYFADIEGGTFRKYVMTISAANGLVTLCGPVREQMEVIQCGDDPRNWTDNNAPVMQYFNGKLRNTPPGTCIKALVQSKFQPGWAEWRWHGWMGTDGRIHVHALQHQAAW